MNPREQTAEAAAEPATSETDGRAPELATKQTDSGAPELALAQDNSKQSVAGSKPRKPRKGKERWQLYSVEDHPGIYRRGDSKKGNYVVVVRAGKGRQFKRTCKTLAEAVRVQAKLRLTPATAQGHDKGTKLFTEYALEWVSGYSGAKKGRTIRKHTRAGFEKMLESERFKEAFGGVKLADVTVDHLEDFARLLEKDNLKPQTVRNIFLPVKLCLASAKRKGHIAVNPAVGYVAGAAKSEDERVVRALDEDELAAFRAAVSRYGNETLTLLVDFLWQTGLRAGEALALNPRHIDFEHRTVSVERRIYTDGFAPPKSKYGKRVVPLSAEMTGRLREYLKNVGYDEPVFRNDAGERLPHRLAASWLLQARKGATVTRTDEFGHERKEPLEWVTMHTLRHTCASYLLRRKDKGGLGLNAREAQHWLGHHSVAFTMDVYATYFEKDVPSAEGFDKVAARLEKASELHAAE